MLEFDGSPAALGLYMPPEWSAHERCWIAWPTLGTPWMDAVDVARGAFAEVARHISRYEPVTMVASPWEAEEAHMTCGPSVEMSVLPLNDCWSRDFGPTFLTDGEGGVAATAWRFNGWGNRYPHDLDEFFAEQVVESLSMKCFQAPLVAEGGAFHVDEHGTLLTTEKVLQSKTRNPTLNVKQIEERLVYFLGARKIIWLPEGLSADRTTDGHIDNLACFAPGGRILVHTPTSQFDPDATLVADVKSRLSQETNAAGDSFEIISVPAPEPGLDHEGKPAVRSYVNFYIANNAIIMPGFDCAQDDEAAQIVGDVYRDHEVVQIDAGPIVFGGGGIHCITQQQPKGKALPPQ
jgi:agmatine deiminase